MGRRKKAIGEIEYALSHIVTSVKRSGKLNLNDNSIISEDLFKSLFNLLYGYDLKNANLYKANERSIDLFFNEERIAYQITSQNSTTKIKKTVQGFIDANNQSKYDRLVILSITDDKKCNTDGLQPLEDIGVEAKYINVCDLEREIFGQETEKLEEIAEYLKYETDVNYKRIHTPPDNDVKKLASLPIVEQLYEVLKAFDGFQCIYPRTLSNIFPFSSTGEAVYNGYSNHCLRTNNKQIHELLCKINVDNTGKITLLDDSLKPYEEKIKVVFERLNDSFVNCICYRENYTEIEHHKIRVKISKVDCDCHYCLYSSLNIRPLFEKLRGKEIQHSEKLDEALSEAYYLCKLGEHLKGAMILQSVANISKSKGDAVRLFIAQYNLTKTRGFIRSTNFEGEQNAILPKIDAIDLNDSSSGLVFPNKTVRDEIVRLKEDYHIKVSRAKIEEYRSSILSVKRLYDNRGGGDGPHSVFLLLDELNLLYGYYLSNNIIKDDYSEFRTIVAISIDALLCSYSTSERYKNQYKEFNSWVLSLILFYVEEDHLEKLFNEWKIDTIIIGKESQKGFIDLVTNFFTFQCVKGIWNSIRYNEDIIRQGYFSHFRQSIRHIQNRTMLLLSKVELPSEDLKGVTQPFIEYLKVAPDFNYSSWQYVVKFLRKQFHIFNETQIQEIIELAFDKNQHKGDTGLLMELCKSAATQASFVSKDHNFLPNLVNSLTLQCKKCRSSHDYEQLLAFWYIADSPSRQAIKQKSIEYLRVSFDSEYYREAVFMNLFTKDENVDFLELYIDDMLKHSSSHDLKVECGQWIFQSFATINSLNCLAYLDVDFSHPKIQEVAKKSEYYDWLINFQSFDYTKFHLDWLINPCPHFILLKLHTVESLKEIVLMELKKEFNSKLSKILVEYLIR